MMIESCFGLKRENLILIEVAAIKHDAKEMAENNAVVANDLINGNINIETFESNVNGSPNYDIFNRFCGAYGESMPAGISRIQGRQVDKYIEKIMKPRLLAERRKSIKPYLDESKDVIE